MAAVIASLKTMRSIYAQLAVLTCFACCRPDPVSILLQNYGKPIKLPKLTVQEVWHDFAHECDWRIFGPGRVREKTADGTYSWRQLHYPSLQVQYAEMKARPIWDVLKNKINEEPSNGARFLIECWTGHKQRDQQEAWIANSSRLFHDERDLVPLLLMEIFSDRKNHEVSAPVGGVLEVYCEPGRMSDFVHRILSRL